MLFFFSSFVRVTYLWALFFSEPVVIIAVFPPPPTLWTTLGFQGGNRQKRSIPPWLIHSRSQVKDMATEACSVAL